MRDRQQQLLALGYRLMRHYYCPIRRRKMPYATRPVFTGSTCVFDNLAAVDRYVRQVEQVREWQREIAEVTGGE